MWQRLLSEIAESGMTEKAIGRAVGCGQATIWRMRNGVASNPGWALGQRIIALHADRCGHSVAHDEQEAA